MRWSSQRTTTNTPQDELHEQARLIAVDGGVNQPRRLRPALEQGPDDAIRLLGHHGHVFTATKCRLRVDGCGFRGARGLDDDIDGKLYQHERIAFGPANEVPYVTARLSVTRGVNASWLGSTCSVFSPRPG